MIVVMMMMTTMMMMMVTSHLVGGDVELEVGLVVAVGALEPSVE